MRRHLLIITSLLLLMLANTCAAEDSRQLVKLPSMMQQHMLANMRDHLQTLNQILAYLGDSKLDKAGQLAEARLGMSSLPLHGASHMASFMPRGMQKTGTAMHRAASRFALMAEEGNPVAAYKALSDVTRACVACHAAYRIH